ncbi:MAG: riboflavin biosynthesis protein RibF, partial [Kiritimatiellae bacterium]|nr:riboflavin biosynthesis protein RibF [Kiritimatiellia bacterium]
MKTVDQMEALAGITGPVVLAAGMFDGVHLGHIALLAEA